MNATARDVASVSSGTLGAMTRERHYSTLDAIHHTWLAWTLAQMDAGRAFRAWQWAWWAWLDEEGQPCG